MSRAGVRLCGAVPAVACALAVAGCGGGGEATPTHGLEPPSAARGKTVFLNAGCGGCHTFAAAGTTHAVGPNLDRAVKRYGAAFVRQSILNPSAYIEHGSSGSIGGKRAYQTAMPKYGPKELYPNTLTEQQFADLIAFLTRRAR